MKLVIINIIIAFFISCERNTAKELVNSTGYSITKVCELPKITKESSGILYFDSILWTINDSGNEPAVYGIDTINGTLLCKLTIDNAVNTDWEAIAQDEKYIYIADNGNNNLSRTMYTVYAISKSLISKEEHQNIEPEFVLNYRFSGADLDMLDLNKALIDSEAIIVRDDSLFIYIKDWQYSKVAVFSIPLDGSSSVAQYRGEYELGYAVTDATIINDSIIAFIGYKDYRSYLSILKTKACLGGEPQMLFSKEISELQGLQTEGLVYEGGKFYISCEKLKIPQALFRLTINNSYFRQGN